MTKSALLAWGWNERWAASFAALAPQPNAAPARVIEQDRDRWLVRDAAGVRTARIPTSSFAGPYPVTGDWVVVAPGPAKADPLSLKAVLPRHTAISRGAPGSAGAEQVLAANIDIVWIVHGLDAPFNARRLERYLAAAWESGAVPEVVLTKSDLAADVDEIVLQVQAVALGVAVRILSTEDAASVERLQARVEPARTYALLGPSGVGKSMLINQDAEVSSEIPPRRLDHVV